MCGQSHGHPDWVSGHVDLWRCVDSPMVTMTGSVGMWTFGDLWIVHGHKSAWIHRCADDGQGSSCLRSVLFAV